MKNDSPFHVSIVLVGSEDERREAYNKALQQVIVRCRGDVRDEKGHYIHQSFYGRTGGKGIFHTSSEI